MTTTKYRFTFGEAFGLFLLLLGAPGAAFGLSVFLRDGASILGLTTLHWQIWASGAMVAAAVSLFTARWQPLAGVPILFMVVIVAGMGDPEAVLSAGDGRVPMERALVHVQAMVKYLGVACPWIFSVLFGWAPVAERIQALRARGTR